MLNLDIRRGRCAISSVKDCRIYIQVVVLSSKDTRSNIPFDFTAVISTIIKNIIPWSLKGLCMSVKVLLLTGLLLAVACGAAAAAKRQGAAWNYYHFDGRTFVAGQPTDGRPFVAVREQTLPVVLTQPGSLRPTPLAPGKGAVTGICYIQTSGGKLTAGSGYTPCPQRELPVFSGTSAVTTVKIDQHGYFTAVLDAGVYRIGDPPVSAEVAVEDGTTRLVPLRAGKRMVD
jgi:hypothetical protein